MDDQISAFIDHMRLSGCGPADPSEIQGDDKKHRYRVDGDKPKSRNGAYCLRVEPDGFAFGWCMTFKEGTVHAWHSKAQRKASDADKADWKRRRDAAKKEAEAARKIEVEAVAAKAKGIWAKAAKDGSTPYLEAKNSGLHGARIARGAVVVPMYGQGGLMSLQFIGGDGRKLFMKGGQKEGCYFPIATRDEPKATMVICEGFATATAIRVATGYPVIAAFDAGNLKPVAKLIRQKYPDTRIIIAADNDQWTTKQDGTPFNPGIEKAQQAAVAIGGAQVVSPSVPIDDADKRTDWDDIARSDGMDAVRLAFENALDHAPQQDDRWEQEYDIPTPGRDPLEVIRPLGHNRGMYYFFPRASGQIVGLSASALSRMQSLYMLAPRGFWEGHYGGDKIADSSICAFASAHLMDVCHQVGIFQPESTRGVGAWVDNGRTVVNCGDVIRGDDLRMHPAEFQGDAVYESGPRVIDLDVEPLRNADAAKLRDICKRLSWKRPQYADMLAGWLVVAPVGSALSWRPHIWITGKSGAGKSTVVDEIVKPTLGDIAIKRDGGTTEPGVRKAIGSSGRPFILDEAESETMAQRQEMEKIIYFARRASSGGVVENANASYRAQSCFCFAAINPRVEQVADRGRITQLELQPDTSPDRKARYAELIDMMHSTLTPDFSRALFARTVQNIDTLLHNVEVFSAAAADLFGNRRSGDQIGPMIAGAYLLTTTKKADPEQARAWIDSQDWNWHTSINEESDSYKLISHIMTSRVRYDAHGLSRESAIGDLIQIAADRTDAARDAADRGLRPYGIRIQDGMVQIANSCPQLRAILKETPYIPWAQTAGDFPGATNAGNRAVYFMAGLTSKVTAIPLAAMFPDKQDEGEELPFDMEDF